MIDLKDKHGRKIRKLRVSLLDACNFRCFYCMPLKAKFMQSSKLLKPSEIESISRHLVQHGIEQIRITGGEPTLRREFRDIVSRLSKLPIQKLGLTTNALLLSKHLDFLKDSLCHNINISLDSLIPEKFNKITRSQSFSAVMEAIHKTKDMGFNLKINTVLMQGHNYDELLDFVDFSAQNGIEIRFLEVMKIGQVVSQQNSIFVPAAKAIEAISQKYELTALSGQEHDSTSFNFVTKEGANIGFIASESKPFCGACSRWRLSAEGMLRACLMSEKGVTLKDLKEEELENKLAKVLTMKPLSRIKEIKQDMHQIGG